MFAAVYQYPLFKKYEHFFDFYRIIIFIIGFIAGKKISNIVSQYPLFKKYEHLFNFYCIIVFIIGFVIGKKITNALL